MHKILIVDDEEDQEELIMQRFAQKDYLREYEFLFANNGMKGLKFVNDHADIDIALLDINMPEMDGLTLLEKIKQINPMIQIVMLSAYGDMSNIRLAMNKGAYDFLNKPIEFKDLEATIKKTILEVHRIKVNARTLLENSQLKQKASDLEMLALRAQMNPHFIFNSLNSINNFILKSNKTQASEYLIKFSKLIRLILENSTQPLISLNQELDALALYIDLERLRFEHKFDFLVDHDIELDLTSIKVPPLILQPFIENAIHHGLIPKQGEGLVKLNIKEQDNYLQIYIEDNGIGRQQTQIMKKSTDFKKKSMGMTLSKDRIALMNAMDANEHLIIHDLVSPEGQPEGTLIILTLPLII